MGAAEEEVTVTLSGGAPWGFRLQGGSEQKRPLQVSKVGKDLSTAVIPGTLNLGLPFA